MHALFFRTSFNVQGVPMIEIDRVLLNPAHIVSAEIEVRDYAIKLVIVMIDGRRIEWEHGFGFDVFATYHRIKDA